jgi:glycosyltransferase involved in cell wall biosynthesis
MSSLPRVAFVAHLGGCSGGAELYLLETALARHAAGNHDVVVVAPGVGELSDRLRAHGVRVEIADNGWWSTFEDPPGSGARLHKREALRCLRETPRWTANILRVLREVRPDVVCSNTVVIPAGAFAAARLRIPHVWLVHEFGRIDQRLPFVLGDNISLTLIGATSAVVLCSSRALAEFCATRVRRRKITIIPYGIETPVGKVVKPRGTAPLRLVLLGRVAHGKGHPDAIRAVAIVRRRGVDVRLRIVGGTESHEYVHELRDLARELDVSDDVEFAGFCDDLVHEIDAADVALMCSTAEAFGRVTVEYQRRGRPVIGTATGGTPELVRDGERGLLYAPGDAVALADRISLLATNASLLEALSRGALEWSSEHCLMTDYVERFSSVLHVAMAS